MKFTRSVAAAVFALSLLFGAALVQASTVSECQQIIANLKTETQDVSLTGKRAETKDRPGMLNILSAASLLLDQAKFCDAIKKLEDYKVKVDDQLKAGQINLDPALGVTASQLITDADSAITCINQLQTQSSGTGCSQ